MSAPEQLFYIGPNTPDFCLHHGAGFIGFPPPVEQWLKRIPAIRGLFVPASELRAAKAALKDPGSSFAILTQFVKEQWQQQPSGMASVLVNLTPQSEL